MHSIEKSSSSNRISEFLNLVEKEFLPPLKTRLNIVDYSVKLAKYATNLFIVNHTEDIAFVSFYANEFDSENSYITILAVKSKFKGLGLANDLIEQVKRISTTKNKKNIFLEVNKNNKIATSCYKKNGFFLHEEKEESKVLMKFTFAI